MYVNGDFFHNSSSQIQTYCLVITRQLTIWLVVTTKAIIVVFFTIGDNAVKRLQLDFTAVVFGVEIFEHFQNSPNDKNVMNICWVDYSVKLFLNFFV